jgi:hypothetical protein
MIDRALQRSRAHGRRAAFIEQELERRRFPFHGPLAMPQPAPLEHQRHFLRDNAAHVIAGERSSPSM